MSYFAAFVYWVIVALWLTVLATIVYFYARNPRPTYESAPDLVTELGARCP